MNPEIDFLTDTVSTNCYEMNVESWVELEKIASRLEITVDYLLDEFAVDGVIDYDILDEDDKN
jgi:hypothetical protein